MSRLREVLDKLHRTAVIIEETEDGRLRLVACLEDEHPITPELTDFCRDHKPLLLAYVRWEKDADKLLIDSTNRLSQLQSQGFRETELAEDFEWLDLERRIHEAYWSMDRAVLLSGVKARETYAREVFARCHNTDDEVKQ